jgi:two-component system response regulator FixJ
VTMSMRADNENLMVGRHHIFLVDDDEAVRDALRLFLESRDFAVREFVSAEALLDVIRDSDSGVIVLDLRLNGLSGLELQTELNSRGIELPIIFISGHGTVSDCASALRQGATDFVEKPFDNDVLLRHIERGLQQENARKQLRLARHVLETRLAKLTPREKEVMQYVVEGVSNKQAAERLGVSSRTIEVHRSRIMLKMGANSLPELVRMAVTTGMLDL